MRVVLVEGDLPGKGVIALKQDDQHGDRLAVNGKDVDPHPVRFRARGNHSAGELGGGRVVQERRALLSLPAGGFQLQEGLKHADGLFLADAFQADLALFGQAADQAGQFLAPLAAEGLRELLFAFRSAVVAGPHFRMGVPRMPGGSLQEWSGGAIERQVGKGHKGKSDRLCRQFQKSLAGSRWGIAVQKGRAQGPVFRGPGCRRGNAETEAPAAEGSRHHPTAGPLVPDGAETDMCRSHVFQEGHEKIGAEERIGVGSRFGQRPPGIQLVAGVNRVDDNRFQITNRRKIGFAQAAVLFRFRRSGRMKVWTPRFLRAETVRQVASKMMARLVPSAAPIRPRCGMRTMFKPTLTAKVEA